MSNADESAPGAGKAAALGVTVTEEGQSVCWDGWAWQRRELTKLLPLNVPWPAEERMAAVLAGHELARPAEAAPVPVPAQVCPDVYLVNSWPNHTYAIDCGSEGLALIDPGLTVNVPRIDQSINDLHLADRGIRWILNTHGHFDHSMADGLFRARGAEVYVGAGDADAVERGSDQTGNYLFPETLPDYPTTKVDRRLVGSERLILGNKLLGVIATPGHTPGSVCFTIASDGMRALFSGDTVLHDFRLGWHGPYSDDDAYLRSLVELARRGTCAGHGSGWDLLLPGHGTIALSQAAADVSKAVRLVRQCVADGTPVPALPFSLDGYRRLMFGQPPTPRAGT